MSSEAEKPSFAKDLALALMFGFTGQFLQAIIPEFIPVNTLVAHSIKDVFLAAAVASTLYRGGLSHAGAIVLAFLGASSVEVAQGVAQHLNIIPSGYSEFDFWAYGIGAVFLWPICFLGARKLHPISH